MTDENKNFLSLTVFQGGNVAFENGKNGQITGIGTISKSLSHAIEECTMGKFSSTICSAFLRCVTSVVR